MSAAVAKVLRDAAALVERGWTQGVDAKTGDGRGTQPTADDAARWCASGALWRACAGNMRPLTEAEAALRRVVSDWFIVSHRASVLFNRACGRVTFAACLQRAALQLRIERSRT